MKWVLPTLFLLLVVAPAAMADDIAKYVELMRSDLRNQKHELLAEALELSQTESDKFWPIQREYETELAKLGDQRVQLIKDYAASYDSLRKDDAKKLMDRAFKLESSRLSLLKKYADKVSKTVSPAIAARFAQVE